MAIFSLPPASLEPVMDKGVKAIRRQNLNSANMLGERSRSGGQERTGSLVSDEEAVAVPRGAAGSVALGAPSQRYIKRATARGRELQLATDQSVA